jgi:methylthioribose-1-phosphate isomerase
MLSPIRWQNNKLQLLDQRVLPLREKWLSYEKACDVATAIQNMVVRGAPAIGITAGYAMALSTIQHKNYKNKQKKIRQDLNILKKSRPTAYNLFWALQQYEHFIDTNNFSLQDYLSKAIKIHQDDIKNNLKMGKIGEKYIQKNDGILTHCNAGALATGGFGTALGVIRAAHNNNKIKKIYADETRPWLQGSRLTAWELAHDNIKCCVITDNTAAHLIREKKVQWIIVGADRITANADVINKIGTYNLAVLAKFHKIGFMVVAPTSTIDKNLKKGTDVQIEKRRADEILNFGEKKITNKNYDTYNVVFDVTPAKLVDVLVTEKEAIENPNFNKINEL